MKIRVIGFPDELDKAVSVLKAYFDVKAVSDLKDSRDDARMKMIYIDVMSKDREIVLGLQDHQLIEYCNGWRSKNDVMHNFDITFEAATEALERLVDAGALIKFLEDKHYVYTDARYVQFAKKECGTCHHRNSTWGECMAGVDLEDVEGEYIPVHHPPCKDWTPSQYSVSEAMTVRNFRIINGEAE